MIHTHTTVEPSQRQDPPPTRPVTTVAHDEILHKKGARVVRRPPESRSHSHTTRAHFLAQSLFTTIRVSNPSHFVRLNVNTRTDIVW